MRTLAAGALVIAMLSASPVRATGVGSPLLGRWSVDVSRLQMPPAARPKRVTITFAEAAGGRWETRVDIVDAGGSSRHAVSTTSLDGQGAPISNDFEADTVALKLPLPNVLVMDLVKGGVTASTRVYTVAPDGRTMTETVSYAGRDGMPFMRTNYFSRVR